LKLESSKKLSLLLLIVIQYKSATQQAML